ncbi:hypothetical protein D3C71_1692270 [compost metagenome]
MLLHRIGCQIEGIVLVILDIAMILIRQVTLEMNVLAGESGRQVIHIHLHVEGFYAVQLGIPDHHGYFVIAIAGSHHPYARCLFTAALSRQKHISHPGLHLQRMEERRKTGMAQIIIDDDVVGGAI